MRNFKLLLALLLFAEGAAQPNCEAFKFYGDSLKYEACLKAMEIKGHYQFSKEYQEALDRSLEIDPSFDYAYWAKSIAYLKSGDFLTWKKLIDKAVALNPEEHLGYRGWCRFQFFRDYEGAIRDIEKLDQLVDRDIGQSQNGKYHLNVAKGLCYKAIGEPEKAIRIIADQVRRNEEQDFVGAYDYLHLGVLYLETGNYLKAMEAFGKQAKINELAENQYYLARTFRQLGREAESVVSLEKAEALYQAGKRMFDYYSNPMDKIYMADIQAEIRSLGGSTGIPAGTVDNSSVYN